eukprot:GGOE01057365.1.p1 GENE.GGOE01057365.1~~GGOE01057365.1.p1  ORF type:complete len:798 (-),score=146.97 GGOE01057365.1:167-2239(-)
MQKPLVSRRIRYVRPRTAGHRRSHATPIADGDASSTNLAQSSCMEEDFSEQALREVFPSSDSSSSSSEESKAKDQPKVFHSVLGTTAAGSTRPAYEEPTTAASSRGCTAPNEPRESPKSAEKLITEALQASRAFATEGLPQKQRQDIIQQYEEQIQQLEKIIWQKNGKLVVLTQLLDRTKAECNRQGTEVRWDNSRHAEEPHVAFGAAVEAEREENQRLREEVLVLRSQLQAAHGHIISLQNDLEEAQSTIRQLQLLLSMDPASSRRQSSVSCDRHSSDGLGCSHRSHAMPELGRSIGNRTSYGVSEPNGAPLEVAKGDLPDQLAIRAHRSFEYEYFAAYSDPFNLPVCHSPPPGKSPLWLFANIAPLRDSSVAPAIRVMDKYRVEAQEQGMPRSFVFDRVFPPNAPPAHPFDEVLALVETALQPQGPEALCVLAYGPRGSGKTHLFYGPSRHLDKEAGMVFRAAFALFSAIEAAGAREACTVDCCMYSYRVDQFMDLLADDLPESLLQKCSARGQGSTPAAPTTVFSGFRAWRACSAAQLCDFITAGLEAIPSEHQGSCNVMCEFLVSRHEPLQHAGSTKVLFGDLVPSDIAESCLLPVAGRATAVATLESLLVCLKAFGQSRPLPRQGNKFVDVVTDVLCAKSAKAQLFVCCPQSPTDCCTTTLGVVHRLLPTTSPLAKTKKKGSLDP